jgi:hypothetical protein
MTTGFFWAIAGRDPIALTRKKIIANTDKNINVFFMISSPLLSFRGFLLFV